MLGAPAFVVGLIEGTADALSSVLKLISGWISDKTRKRKMPAVLGYTLSVLIRPLLTLVTNFWQVFSLRALDRVGKGFRDAPRDALIAESVPPEEFGRSYGFHRSMDTLGATVGPLVALLILGSLGKTVVLSLADYHRLFLIAFVIGLGAIFSFVFVKDPGADPALKKGEYKRKPKLNWQLLRDNRRFALVVFAIFVFGLGTLPIGLVLLKEAEVAHAAEVPFAYFVYGLMFVLTAIPLGRLADKVGERSVIAFGFLVAVVAYLGLASARTFWAASFFFAVLGVYSAATDGLQRALAARVLPSELLATGQGFLNMAIGFSSLGAGIIGGLLWTSVNSRAALFYAASLSLIGLFLFLGMTHRRAHE